MGLRKSLLDALSDDKLSHARQKYVYAVYILHRNREGHAWPSPSSIMRYTGLGRSAVFQSIKDLQALGYLKQVRVRNRRATTYFVREPESVLPPPTPGNSSEKPSPKKGGGGDGDDWVDGILGEGNE